MQKYKNVEIQKYKNMEIQKCQKKKYQKCFKNKYQKYLKEQKVFKNGSIGKKYKLFLVFFSSFKKTKKVYFQQSPFLLP